MTNAIVNILQCILLIANLRLWYISLSTRRNTTTAHAQATSLPTEIGYMNVIPKCLDGTGKYPVYENLPETYSAVNMYLTANPLEGIHTRTRALSVQLYIIHWGFVFRTHETRMQLLLYRGDS